MLAALGFFSNKANSPKDPPDVKIFISDKFDFLVSLSSFEVEVFIQIPTDPSNKI